MNILEKYGLTRIINALGHYTKLGGSVLSPEVIEAMTQAAQLFIDLDELQEKASQVIAQITGAEAAYVASGCAAALTLATAACMTKGDPAQIYRLPNSDGLNNEVIIHRAHRNAFDLAFRNAGAKLVEIGLLAASGTQEWEFEQAVSSKTAAVAYIISSDVISRAALSLPRVVDLAHAHNLPVVLDAAAELPPASNLRKFIDLGVDLVTFSGGKGIRGPNASGFVCGRQDLIEACRMQGSPHFGIGRPMKAGKEEIIGLLAAIEQYVQKDHHAELSLWEQRMQYLLEGVAGLKGVTAYRQFPDDTGRPVPMIWLTINSELAKKPSSELVRALKDGDPSIWVLNEGEKIRFSPLALQDGDERVIVERLREELA